jgi:hypothetical protein
MRTRNVSARTSDRISGHGFRLGCVDFLPRLAHATREDRARHAVQLPHHRAAELLVRRRDAICVVEADADLCEPDRPVLLLASSTSI